MTKPTPTETRPYVLLLETLIPKLSSAVVVVCASPSPPDGRTANCDVCEATPPKSMPNPNPTERRSIPVPAKLFGPDDRTTEAVGQKKARRFLSIGTWYPPPKLPSKEDPSISS